MVLAAIGFGVYAVNLHNPLFWDDEDWIVYNPAVHALTWNNARSLFSKSTLGGLDLTSNYYRPALFLTFAINYAISGIHPVGYHLVNNLLHVADALLAGYLLWLLFRNRLMALLAGAAFLLHPLNTEAVTYVSGRGDPLHYFFMLASLVLLLRNKKGLSLVLVPFALLSQEKAIILPFLVVLALWTQQKKIKPALIASLPYFGLTLVYGILRLTVLNFGSTLNLYLAPNVYTEHVAIRFYAFLHVLAEYARLLVAPVGLHMERGVTLHASFFEWPVWFVAMILAGLVALLVRLHRRHREHFPVWFFGLAWFFVTILPVSGITPVSALLYEHWMYVPMLGPIAIAAWYLVKLYQWLKAKPTLWRAMFLAALAGYAVFYGVQDVRRNMLWGRPVEFYKDILRYEPDSARINNNLGNEYFFRERNSAKAEEYYLKAVAANDIFPQPHYNLGSILEARGDVYGAVKEYEAALQVDPKFYYALQSIVVLYAKQANYPKAIEAIEQLKLLRPNDSRVLYNAATLYMAEKNKVAARQNAEAGLAVVGNDRGLRQLFVDLLNKLK